MGLEKIDPSCLDRERRLEDALQSFLTPERAPRMPRDDGLLRRGLAPGTRRGARNVVVGRRADCSACSRLE